MNSLSKLLRGLALSLILAVPGFAQSTNTNTIGNVTGQWDFTQGDLRATIGTNMVFLGDTASQTTFEALPISNATAQVMHFPAATSAQGFLVFHGAKPNGGGTNVNEYTVIMDLMWPAESDGTFRALISSDTNNAADPIMFVNPDNQIGVQNDYAGEMLANTWYRLGLVFDLTNGIVTKYLNGSLVSTQSLGENVLDSQYSLGPALLLFTSNREGDTASGYVNSIQVIGEALSGEQMASLGGPTAAGIGLPDLPTTDLEIESIRQDGTNFVITVSGGGTILLQRKSTLSDTNWQDAGTSATGTFTVPASGPTSFFRARRQ